MTKILLHAKNIPKAKQRRRTIVLDTVQNLRSNFYFGYFFLHTLCNLATYFRWAPCGLTRMPGNFEICLEREWEEDFAPRILAQCQFMAVSASKHFVAVVRFMKD